MRYPIGNQEFRPLRDDGFVYVDKTEHICRIPDAGKYFFLSRPRRFGKSLTVSTIKELYSGDRELFAGLWAYENWGFAERRRPVIHVKFDETGFQTTGLPAAINYVIDYEAKRLGVPAPPGEAYGTRFRQLIEAVAATHESGRCVVLIDEYDKPIIHDLRDVAKATHHRDLLRPFYGVLKGADEYLELVFITGVSAFSKVSLFSDLNNISQLTLDPLAHTLVGLTEGELDRYFAGAIAATGIPREEVRHWYNGYSWGGERVYNPWSILQFLRSGQRSNYWSDSGTPAFVTDLMARGGEYDIEGEEASPVTLTSFDLANVRPVAILWQGGYLTLDEPTLHRGRYTLRYPNAEVEQTFTEVLLRSYGFHKTDPTEEAIRIERALFRRDLDAFREQVDRLLAAVPYELWRDATERFYHAIVLTAFRFISTFEVKAEVSSARGRADIIMETPEHVYAIEFKLLRPSAAALADEDVRAAEAADLAEAALAQIAERDYLGPYRGGKLEPVALAVVFDAERRRVGELREA